MRQDSVFCDNGGFVLCLQKYFLPERRVLKKKEPFKTYGHMAVTLDPNGPVSYTHLTLPTILLV